MKCVYSWARNIILRQLELKLSVFSRARYIWMNTDLVCRKMYTLNTDCNVCDYLQCYTSDNARHDAPDTARPTATEYPLTLEDVSRLFDEAGLTRITAPCRHLPYRLPRPGATNLIGSSRRPPREWALPGRPRASLAACQKLTESRSRHCERQRSNPD